MATANELLAMLTNSEGDKVLVIDNDLRTINIPKSVAALGVEADDDVHRLSFRMPQYLGTTDLSTFSIRINYMNANNEGDIYVVTDKTVTDSVITFSWLVGPNALRYKGDVKFIVCLKDADSSDGTINREFNTTVATLPVLEGLEVDAAPLEGELSDILAQLPSIIDDALGYLNMKMDECAAELETKTTELIGNASYVRSRGNGIANNSSGESVIISDSSDDYLQGLRVFGKTTQVVSTGAQVCNFPNVVSMTSAGVIWTCTNGVITANGTTTGTSSTAGGIEFDMTGRVGMYYVSGSTPNVSVYCSVTSNDGNTVWYKDRDFTLYGDEKKVVVYCQVYGANVLVNEAVYPMVVNGIVDEPWEPYTNEKPSPTPTNPSALNNVNTNTNVSVFGKNLLPYPYVFTSPTTMGGATFTDNGDGGIKISGTPTEYGGVNLASNLPLDSDISIALFGDYENAVFDVNLYVGNTSIGGFSSRTTATIYRDQYPKNTRVTVFLKRGMNNAAMSGIVYPMIISGSTRPAEYVPYAAVQNVSVPYTLRGIPVTSGGNYTDAEGQQWVCDEIDFERGKYIQRIDRLLLDNTAAWSAYNYQTANYGFTIWNLLGEVGDSYSRVPGLCNQFDTVGVGSDNCVWVGVGNRNIYVISKEWYDKGIDAWKNHVKDHPIEIIYPLANPIYHDLTPEELAAFHALRSNHPTTTVLNNAGAWMAVKYNADTKTYVDSTAKNSSGSGQVKVLQMKVYEDYVEANMTPEEVFRSLDDDMIPVLYVVIDYLIDSNYLDTGIVTVDASMGEVYVPFANVTGYVETNQWYRTRD